MRTGALPAATDGTAAAEATADADTDGTMTEGSATADATTDGTMADGTATADSTMVDGAAAVDGYASVDTGAITSDQLMGVRVFGPNDEDVGEISDLVLDANGTPSQVIVDVGGFLGMGEKPVAIDVTKLQILQASEGGALRAYIQMTQDQLETLPAAKM